MGQEAFDQACSSGQTTLVGEFVAFLRANKKWWLLPILLMLALIAVLGVLAGSSAAPFIYTLF